MKFPDGFDYTKCIPTKEDFWEVFNCKKTGHYPSDVLHNSPYYDQGDYYYGWIRRLAASILLDWRAAGLYVQDLILKHEYDAAALKRILVYIAQNKDKYIEVYTKYRADAVALGQPEEQAAANRNARKGEISVNVKNPNGGFFRIIEYSMKYGDANPNKTQSGARMHLYINKKVSDDVWGISVRGSNTFGSRRTELDEPFFASEQEARDFIANIDKQHIPTAVSLEDWRFVISDKPVDYEYDQDARKFIKKADLKGAKKINTICGPCYMLDKCRFYESLNEEQNMEEDIEKHDTLNPVLFANNKLKPEIRERLLKIANTFIEGLAEDNIKFNLKDIVFIGSNASYNYTKDSDIDLHLVADIDSLNCPDNLYPLLYGAYRSIFNKKFNIDFYGIRVELFVEPEGAPTVSNGIYSVLKDSWIKEPTQVDIPEINMDEFNKEFQPWEDRYNALIAKIEAAKTTEEYQTLGLEIEKLVTDIYEQRKMGIAVSEYDTKNLLFKEFRNRGYLDNLKELKSELKAKELSLPDEKDEFFDEAWLGEYLNDDQRYEVSRDLSQAAEGNPTLVSPDDKFQVRDVPTDRAEPINQKINDLPYVDDALVDGEPGWTAKREKYPHRNHVIVGKVDPHKVD